MTNIVQFTPSRKPKRLPMQCEIFEFRKREYPAHFHPMFLALSGMFFALAILKAAMGEGR